MRTKRSSCGILCSDVVLAPVPMRSTNEKEEDEKEEKGSEKEARA